MKNIKLLLLLSLIFISAPLLADIDTLDSLELYGNDKLKALREDVKRSLYIIKSGRNAAELPNLKFLSYKVKKGENFWTVLTKTSLDMDTLMSINSLTCPSDIIPGKTIYVPNMRGIILNGKKREEIFSIIQDEKIKEDYVFKLNRSRTLDRDYIFIPGGKISNIERSLFLGTGFIFPLKVNGMRTSGFGTRKNPFNQRHSEFHPGIDIACAMRSEVTSGRSGEVVFTGFSGGYGQLVIIKHEHNYSSYYGHLSKILVKNGDKVTAGQTIALSGNSGRTTGPHLHFETRNGSKPFNPGVLIKKS